MSPSSIAQTGKGSAPGLDELCQTIERDGLVPFRGYIDRHLASLAHAELDRWFEIDLESRRKSNEQSKYHTGDAGYSSLDSTMHILYEVFGKSPALDRMVEIALTDPHAGGVLHHVAGRHLKLRGYNVRRMTGETKNSGMEWHRDNRGEVGWSFVLSATDASVDGATSFVRGSHLYPYCARQQLLFPWTAYEGFRVFQKLNLFSRIARKRYVDNYVASASGSCGDFYVFINDLWHGRDPNLQGKKTMVFLASVFPTEMPFPNEVPIPSNEVLARLPKAVRDVVDYRNSPNNEDRSAYLYRMYDTRQQIKPFSIWQLGQLERRFVDYLSKLKAIRLNFRLQESLRPYYLKIRDLPVLGKYIQRLVRLLR